MSMREVGNRLVGVRRFGPLLAGLLAAGCVVAPPPGAPPAPTVEVLRGDARAFQYGSNAAELLAHPDAREAVRRLFGSEQSQTTTRLSRSAADFFGNPAPTRVVRIAGADYLAATGCVPSACSTHPGLLLIRADGEELFARLDDGGFSHYYGFGTRVEMTPRTLALIDAAWRALRP